MKHCTPLFRKSAVVTTLAAALAAAYLIATPAYAGTSGLARYAAELINNTQKAIAEKALSMMGLGIEQTVAQSGAATQAEIAKGAMANKTVLEGLEAYRQELALKKQAVELTEDLRQPATTCSTLAAQGGIGTAHQNAQAQVFRDQSRALTRIRGNTSTVAALERSHTESNATFCTAAEAARGVCKPGATPEARQLAGADQNALYLFKGTDGSDTYTGGVGGLQTKAADGYIGRVVAGLPPEHLGNGNYAKNPQGRAYIELMRRYAAITSLSAYSLNQIKAARTPQANLGVNSSMANVTAGGFAAGKNDMSMLEAVQRFIALKFSPAAIQDSARAVSPNLILRDMAQVGAFQLWVDHQTLLQDSRTEALMAEQLALVTERTLRPQLEAQRAAATRAAKK